MKPNIIKLLEENKREDCCVFGLDNNSLTIMPKINPLKKTLVSWISLNPELLLLKDTVKIMERQVKDWEKYLQMAYLKKNFYLEHRKNSQKSIIRQQATKLENKQSVWSDTLQMKIYRRQI